MESNRKTQLELLGVVTLLVVLGLLLKPLFKQGAVDSNAAAVSSAQHAPAIAQPTAKPDQALVFAAAQEPKLDTIYTASTLRDPLKSLLPSDIGQAAAGQPSYPNQSGQSQALQPPSVTVEGLVWGGRAPQAVIDGEVYNVGDTVNGARIVAITRTGVTLEMGGATFEISPEPSAQGSHAEANAQYSFHP